MAFTTENTFTGNGSTTDFSFTFPYIAEADVKVTITDANGDPQPNTAFTFANATTLSFDTAPTSGRTIRIFRDTNLDSAVVTYFAGSAIRAEDLNDNQNQVLFSAQEVENNAVLTTGSTITGDQVFTTGTVVFEGATDDDFETTLAVTDPTADRTITLPNAEGHIALFTADPGSTTISATPAELNTLDGITASVSELNFVDGVTSNVQTQLDNKQPLDSELTELATMASGTASALADLTQTEVQILDGATVTTAELNRVDATSSIQTQLDNKQPLDAELTELATMGSNTAAALADLTQAEVQILDGATVTTAELNRVDATSSIQTQLDAKQASDAELTELATMSSGTASALADLTQTEVQILDGATVTTDQLNRVDATSSIQTQLDAKQPLDAELTELATMASNTASALADLQNTEVQILDGATLTTTELNTLDGVNSTLTAADLNQLDSNSLSNSVSSWTSGTTFPSAAQVDARITARIDPIGGFEAIADDESFPNTAPAEGVLISIANAGGLTVNSSGTSTNGDTLDNTTVTINNFPSGFNSTTLDDGIGLLVIKDSGTGHSYDFHRVVAKNEDVRQLSSDINDFKARYRVGASNPTTDNDEGDLFYNTGSDKMLVWDGSEWDEVQSIGEYFIIPSSDFPTWNGSINDISITSNAPANAEQIILSINGVIQEPKAGTARPSEGFSLNGSTIQLSAAPASGSDAWGVIIGSTVNIGTPSANTVGPTQLIDTAVTAGSYTLSSITVDAQGRITAASSGSAGDSDKIEEGNTSVECTDTNSNGTITFTTEGTSRMTINNSGLANITLDAEISGHTIGKGNNSHASNVAFGSGTLHAASSNARNNVAIGLQALNDVTDGDGNVGVGKTAGEKITTGIDNIAIGLQALAANTTSDSNVAVGAYSLLSTTGSENVGVGLRSLQNCTTGVRNIGIGGYALANVTEGDNNIGIGRDAGNDITTGDENIIIGKNVGQAISTGTNNVIIGGPTTNYASNLSSTIVLGIQGTERMRIDSSGNVGIGTTSPSQRFQVSGSNSQYAAITSTNSSNTGILFGDSGDIDAGYVLYSNSADSLSFGANAADRMIINSSGNVGVNTTSPSQLLTVRTTGTSTTVGGNIAARIESAADGRDVTFQLSDSVNNSATISMIDSHTVFGQAGTERMRIDSSGRLLVGATSATNNSIAEFSKSVGSGAAGCVITVENTSTNSVNNTAGIDLKTSEGRARFYTFRAQETYIESRTGGVSDLILQANGASKMRFYTGNTERMLIDASGHLVPKADSTYNLGASGTRWTNVYADNLHGDGSNITNLPDASGQGVAKRWVSFNQSSIIDSYNVSTVSDNGTGSFTVNFSSNMANANYAVTTGSSSTQGYVIVVAIDDGYGRSGYKTNGGFSVFTHHNGNSSVDEPLVSCVVHGD